MMRCDFFVTDESVKLFPEISNKSENYGWSQFSSLEFELRVDFKCEHENIIRGERQLRSYIIRNDKNNKSDI